MSKLSTINATDEDIAMSLKSVVTTYIKAPRSYFTSDLGLLRANKIDSILSLGVRPYKLDLLLYAIMWSASTTLAQSIAKRMMAIGVFGQSDIRPHTTWFISHDEYIRQSFRWYIETRTGLKREDVTELVKFVDDPTRDVSMLSTVWGH